MVEKRDELERVQCCAGTGRGVHRSFSGVGFHIMYLKKGFCVWIINGILTRTGRVGVGGSSFLFEALQCRDQRGRERTRKGKEEEEEEEGEEEEEEEEWEEWEGEEEGVGNEDRIWERIMLCMRG